MCIIVALICKYVLENTAFRVKHKAVSALGRTRASSHDVSKIYRFLVYARGSPNSKYVVAILRILL